MVCVLGWGVGAGVELQPSTRDKIVNIVKAARLQAVRCRELSRSRVPGMGRMWKKEVCGTFLSLLMGVERQIHGAVYNFPLAVYIYDSQFYRRPRLDEYYASKVANEALV